MEEEAKAAQEIAKTTGKALDVSQRIGSFFAKVMSEPIEAATGMLADSLRYRRFERQIKLIEKTEHLLESRGLRGGFRTVPPKLALPIIQGASFEDNDNLHSLWAGLLATAMDPNEPMIRTGFSDILRQLEPVDVAILAAMHRHFEVKMERYEELGQSENTLPPTAYSISKHDLISEVEIKDTQYWTSIDNLTRLGLSSSYIDEDTITIETAAPNAHPGRPLPTLRQTKDTTETYDIVKSHGGYYNVCMTALGDALVKACRIQSK